ncbi:hypothetical protein R1sor_010433 [Riccia sorocarpa]|uniref:Gamma-tubulin complex component n=1 Tax=Riccia sorocarpa TaxID=122646 RepID=A0ABD3I1Q9_9MARC
MAGIASSAGGVGDALLHKQKLFLQQKLMHFVNTLHQYVMARVLYSAWVELCEGMSSAGSLDEVKSCHDSYLVSIQRQCLVAHDKLQFDECLIFLMRVLSFKLNVGHFPHVADLAGCQKTLITFQTKRYDSHDEAGGLLHADCTVALTSKDV